MNLSVEMIDMNTGEVLGRKSANYVLNFATKNDAGFVFLMRWLQSCVRGVRLSDHKDIQLRVSFHDDKESLFLPFGMSVEQADELAKQYVY